MKKRFTAILLLTLLFAACASHEIPDRTDPSYESFWADFRAEWIDLEKEPFKRYAKFHTKEFDWCPYELEQEAIAKWKRFFGSEPWPADEKPKEAIKFRKPNEHDALGLWWQFAKDILIGKPSWP